MDQTQRKPQKPVPTVEHVTEHFSEADLNDLCDATDAAIEGGGGFGWVNLPSREILERYWQGVITAPTRELFVARLDHVICGTVQVVVPAKNNEAQAHMLTLTTNFVAPWARGHGLARTLLETVEEWAMKEGFSVINLDVRETMDAAIALYETLGYEKLGVHPYAVKLDDKAVKSVYYYKLINSDIFK
ncbi:MAG: GNAT family N-acetyltransferase [Pseudomonadota bacterium]